MDSETEGSSDETVWHYRQPDQKNDFKKYFFLCGRIFFYIILVEPTTDDDGSLEASLGPSVQLTEIIIEIYIYSQLDPTVKNLVLCFCHQEKHFVVHCKILSKFIFYFLKKLVKQLGLESFQSYVILFHNLLYLLDLFHFPRCRLCFIVVF